MSKMTIRIPLVQRSFLILVYAPTLSSEDEDKTAFYDQLTLTIVNIPNFDKFVMLGDLNARIGRDHHLWKGIVGHHCIGKCNATGELSLGFCAEHNLIVTNTLFQLPILPSFKFLIARKRLGNTSGTCLLAMSLQEQETCVSHDPCLEQITVGWI